MHRLTWACFLVAFVSANGRTETTKVVTYKKGADYQLDMTVHYPPEWKAGDKRPAIVFFFGGGWKNGNIKQFEDQATYFAKRGMVAARADYRVKSRQGVAPHECVEDAKSAVRYLRTNAQTLGIDPDRICASGGSAGGHLAIATFTTTGLEAEGEDLNVSSKPNLLVLYNPALIDAKFFVERGTPEAMAKKIAPNAHLSKQVPPTLIFFGTDDRLIEGGKEFLTKAKTLGIDAELYTAKGQKHGFFNRAPWKPSTTEQADKFLTKHGYLEGEPTIEVPEGAELSRLESTVQPKP